MKTIKYFLMRAWVIHWFITFAILFFLSYPIYRIVLSKQKWYFIANRLRKIWSRLFFPLIGIFYKIDYDSNFKKEYFDKKKRGTYIFCPNHTSFMDIPLITLILRGEWRFMAKAELLKVPMFNIFFRTIDISVDRTKKTNSYLAYQQAAKSLDEKISLIMFPEGTTSRIAPKLLRFKNGPFKLAIEKKVPIVPVTFLDNWRLFPNNGSNLGKPGLTRAIVHQAIETNDLTEIDENALKNKVYNIIDKRLKKEYEN